MEITQIDPAEFERYTEKLKALGWCLECQGMGQVPEEDDPTCPSCHDSGKSQKDSSE